METIELLSVPENVRAIVAKMTAAKNGTALKEARHNSWTVLMPKILNAVGVGLGVAFVGYWMVRWWNVEEYRNGEVSTPEVGHWYDGEWVGNEYIHAEEKWIPNVDHWIEIRFHKIVIQMFRKGVYFASALFALCSIGGLVASIGQIRTLIGTIGRERMLEEQVLIEDPIIQTIAAIVEVIDAVNVRFARWNEYVEGHRLGGAKSDPVDGAEYQAVCSAREAAEPFLAEAIRLTNFVSRREKLKLHDMPDGAEIIATLRGNIDRLEAFVATDTGFQGLALESPDVAPTLHALEENLARGPLAASRTKQR